MKNEDRKIHDLVFSTENAIFVHFKMVLLLRVKSIWQNICINLPQITKSRHNDSNLRAIA